MTQTTKLSGFLLFLTLLIASAGCHSKNDVAPPLSVIKRLLTAHTWQINEVTDTQNGNATTVYKRGAAHNEDDFSLVRQQFTTDGRIIYTDQFGDSGANGTYVLLDNDTRIRLGMPDMGLSVTADQLKVTDGEFSYQLENNDGHTTFIFGPAK